MGFKKTLPILISIFIIFDCHAESKKESPKQSSSSPIFTYHNANLEYHYTPIPGEVNLDKSSLHVLNLEGEFSLVPKIKLRTEVPFIYRKYKSRVGSTTTIGNPYLGVLAEVLTGIDRDFPTFAFLEGGVKFPLHSETAVTFERTDLSLGIRYLKEVYYFTLGTHAYYIIKIDHDNTGKNHGNEFNSFLSAALHTGFKWDFTFDFKYRLSFGYKDRNRRISSQSIFSLSPSFIYHFNPNLDAWTSLSIPLRDAQFNNIAFAFGDFESPGLLGPTFSLGVSYKF